MWTIRKPIQDFFKGSVDNQLIGSDENAIDTRSQTSSETSQGGGGGWGVETPSTLPLDPPLFGSAFQN